MIQALCLQQNERGSEIMIGDNVHASVHLKHPGASGGYLHINNLGGSEMAHHHRQTAKAVAVGGYEHSVMVACGGHYTLLPATPHSGNCVLKRFSKRQLISCQIFIARIVAGPAGIVGCEQRRRLDRKSVV